MAAGLTLVTLECRRFDIASSVSDATVRSASDADFIRDVED